MLVAKLIIPEIAYEFVKENSIRVDVKNRF